MIRPELLIPAIAYLRMSDVSQDTSIDQQRTQITQFAERNNYKIVKWYCDEGKSGSHSVQKRVEFLKMLSDVQEGLEARAVLCLDISRFGRLDTIDSAFAKQILREARVILHTVIEGKIDWRKQNDRIIEAVLSEGQHDFSFRLGQKTLQGKLKAFLDGKCFGFKVPYGFARRIIADDGQERIVLRTAKFTRPNDWGCQLIEGDSLEVGTVKWMFKEFDCRDIGYRWIASELNLKGILSPKGKKWHAKVVQDILQNEKYVGDMTLGQRSSGKFWRLLGNEVVRADEYSGESKPLIIKNLIPAIIDREVFDRVQRKIQTRQQSGHHSPHEGGYALKGCLFCGQCGKPLYGNCGKATADKRKAGKTIYVCKTAINYGKSCDCGQWSVEETAVLGFLKNRAVPALNKSDILRRHFNPKPETKDVSRIERKLEDLHTKIKQGTTRFLTAPDDLTAEIQNQLSEWKSEKKELESELEQANRSNGNWQDVIRYRCLKMEELKDQLVHLTLGSSHNGKYSSGALLLKDSFRQLLTDAGVRVDLWWERASACRWKVAKVRLQIGMTNPQVETHPSLIV